MGEMQARGRNGPLFKELSVEFAHAGAGAVAAFPS